MICGVWGQRAGTFGMPPTCGVKCGRPQPLSFEMSSAPPQIEPGIHPNPKFLRERHVLNPHPPWAQAWVSPPLSKAHAEGREGGWGPGSHGGGTRAHEPPGADAPAQMPACAARHGLHKRGAGQRGRCAPRSH